MSEALSEVLRALDGLRREVALLAAEVRDLRAAVSPPPRQDVLPFSVPPPAEQLVTLDQCAAIIRRSKRTLEDLRGRMPAARVRGRKGRQALWAWEDVRPWLEEYSGRSLPATFPAFAG